MGERNRDSLVSVIVDLAILRLAWEKNGLSPPPPPLASQVVSSEERPNKTKLTLFQKDDTWQFQ